MKMKKEEIPVTMQAPGTIMRGFPGWGGMTVAFNEIPAGTDMSPLLKGLKNDSCQCPHWGYILEGELLMKYDDQTEENLFAGDVFYMQPGHTGITKKDTKLIDFSPERELKEVMDHIAKKWQNSVSNHSEENLNLLQQYSSLAARDAFFYSTFLYMI